MNRSIDITNELKEISPIVAAIGNENIFTVATGYFNTVPATVLVCINNEIAVKNEVPEGYFDNLANTVLSKIQGTTANELQQLSPLLAGLSKTAPFEVPENYFEQVSEAITIQALKEKMPAAFDNINKEQPFEIPVGYFDQLAGNILNKTKEQTSVKVVTMPKRFVAIWKYAAAAVFTGAIALGIYKYTGNTTATDVPVAMNQAKFDETLDNLAEEDIIKYLDKNGTEEDMASLTSGIDEKDLPDQEEYFTDEATLDNFLKDIELKN